MVDAERAVANLSALVRIATVSHVDERDTDWRAFDELSDELERRYPAVHRALARERIGRSLLYRWRGSDAGDASVLMAHLDVVPATDDGWSRPAFSGEVVGDGDERAVWGRGALDDKGSLVAILEAVESLAERGFRPRNDVYLAFGHNEETSGDGAPSIVTALRERGVRAKLVLDEGGAVVEGVFPGVSDPVAVIGLTEKGIATVRLTVEQHGGHASTPPRLTATARLARAITRLTDSPFPARMRDVHEKTFAAVGARASGVHRLLFARPRLTGPLLARLMGRLSDETRAMLATTVAVTRLSGSPADNVLADRATATLNVRVAVGSSVGEAVDHIRRAVRDDAVAIEVSSAFEPSPVSSTDGPGWRALVGAIGAVYPTAVVVPYVMLQASDSRHFAAISDSVYRFLPFDLTSDERAAIHAVDERIRVSTLERGIRFMEALLTSL